MKIIALSICILFQIGSPSFAQDTTHPIKIAVKEFPPFVFKDLSGFCIDMAKNICERNGLKPEFVYYETVQEVLNAVETGECDINFSGITITAKREKRVDFSHPFFDAGLIVAVKGDPDNRLLNLTLKILKVIGYSLLIFLIGLTVVAHAIWFLEKSDNDPTSFPTDYKRGILDAYWWAVVTMTTVGYGDKCPKKIIGRVIASIWMIIGIIWFAAFTATLTSSLTINRIVPGEIKGLTDLSNKRVSVIKGTTSEKFMHYHDVTIMLTETFDDLIRSLKTGNVDAVVYDAPTLMYIAKKDPSIKVVGEMFDEQRYGVVFPQGQQNPYKEMFNIAILEMQGSGEYRRIYNKWF
ncbi:MAG: transporter substrate-binding domain-containing protein [Desulfosarcina sp.]|nr:transporter substrate-binding domain-containing protein [Desulfosarcina sp.]